MKDKLTSLLKNNVTINVLVHVLLAVIMFCVFVQAGYSIGRFIYYLKH